MLLLIGNLLFTFLIILTSSLSYAQVDTSVLTSRAFSLENRHKTSEINRVFADNILLNLAYLSGEVRSKEDINWDKIKTGDQYQLILNPGETFAYHKDVLDAFSGNVIKAPDVSFNSKDGFKSSGFLYGDGVCHLASLLYWTAKDAGLEALAPTNHDFALMPDIPPLYGVSIYRDPTNKSRGASQNLYITNNKHHAVIFQFEYNKNAVTISILEDKTRPLLLSSKIR